MKKFIYLSVLLVILLICVPIITIFSSAEFNGEDKISENKSYQDEEKEDENLEKAFEQANKNVFKIYDKETEETVELSDYDFVKYTLAKAMPITYLEEALKAQAVAIYTYYSLIRSREEKIEYSSKENELFYDKEELQEKWGEDFDKNYEKLEKAVKEVFPQVLKYNNELIESVTFEYSAGVTEDGEYIGIENAPYLSRVSSPYDQYNEEYISIYKFSEKELKEIITKEYDKIELSDNYQEWFSNMEYDESGNVIKVTLGDKNLTGKDIEKLFDLKSSAFDILYTFEEFVFNVKGSGNFVGMSKYGAEQMAKQGSDYKEILTHYYSGVNITL